MKCQTILHGSIFEYNFFSLCALACEGETFPLAQRRKTSLSVDERGETFAVTGCFCFERHDFLFSHSNGDLLTCELYMLYVLFLTTSSRKLTWVFHWWLYDKLGVSFLKSSNSNSGCEKL